MVFLNGTAIRSHHKMADPNFSMIQRQGNKNHPRSNVKLKISPVFIVAGMLWGLFRIASFRALLTPGNTECCALINEILASGSTHEQLIDCNAIRAMKSAS
ncbi:hypothetical protein [Acetobacter aceti]|uniref:hypothetical protein n=1 Tax=Acetobacter aceti TaxID=435 RepID=UPI00104888D2|nr:hypothetical protein [Acetobacter aceti]